MSRFDWDIAIWGAWFLLFLVFELSAVFLNTPWTTLSTFSWKLESLSDVAKVVFLAGLVVLTVHIVAHWPS